MEKSEIIETLDIVKGIIYTYEHSLENSDDVIFADSLLTANMWALQNKVHEIDYILRQRLGKLFIFSNNRHIDYQDMIQSAYNRLNEVYEIYR